MGAREVRVATGVADALGADGAVVALESTLIAHGLPWPQNLETALTAEAAVREAGAIPCTIALVGGEIAIGLSAGEIERIARSVFDADASFLKASRRDLSWAAARRLDAATTVSATLWLARKVGIGVMATGGLGGVHRGATESFDVSTDLDALAEADGSVVICSGVKSILDIPATLEALETRGVPVIGYGTNEFPAFTSRSSGLSIEARVDSIDEAVEVVRAHRALGLPGAILLAQPVAESIALDHSEAEAALQKAMSEARTQGITGKRVTPFLLERVREAMDGRDVRANTALIVANARLAGAIAVALAS